MSDILYRNGEGEEVLDVVQRELARAMGKHGPMASAHEAYSVILEELDEFWDECRKRSENRSPKNMREELVQIAAMACRAIIDLKLGVCCDEPQ